MNIEVGQAIQYDKIRGSEVGYGVVINVSDSCIEFVEVNSINKFVKCYDDVGAVYPDDKDNVRLKDCPPPFSKLSRGREGAVYAVADIDHPIIFTKEQCQQYHVSVLNNGKQISKEDMEQIFNHPWMDQMQKEKLRNRRNSIVRDLENKFDFGKTNEKDMECSK